VTYSTGTRQMGHFARLLSFKFFLRYFHFSRVIRYIRCSLLYNFPICVALFVCRFDCFQRKSSDVLKLFPCSVPLVFVCLSLYLSIHPSTHTVINTNLDIKYQWLTLPFHGPDTDFEILQDTDDTMIHRIRYNSAWSTGQIQPCNSDRPTQNSINKF